MKSFEAIPAENDKRTSGQKRRAEADREKKREKRTEAPAYVGRSAVDKATR